MFGLVRAPDDPSQGSTFQKARRLMNNWMIEGKVTTCLASFNN